MVTVFHLVSERRHFELTSLTRLREAVKESADQVLRETFRDSIFVGCVSEKHCLIQHQTRLYIFSMERVAEEFFYQRLLDEFGNCGVINLSVIMACDETSCFIYGSRVLFFSFLQDPPPLYNLALMAMDLEENGWQPEDGPKDHLAKQASALLKMKAEMLDDYFSLQINEESHLLGIPLLLGNYIWMQYMSESLNCERSSICILSSGLHTRSYSASVLCSTLGDGRRVERGERML